LASNELALDVTSGRSGYWQAMSWHWTQYREEQVLASNELALNATTGRSGYWQAMSWHWTQYREERVLASNALALDAMGYKHDLARVRA
jgi:hypothetical protein